MVGPADERGAGMIGTLMGAGVFVLLMLFAVQVLLGLYTTSVVTAATYDAAKAVAGSDLGAGRSATAMADAERNAQEQLGGFGRRVTFTWGPAGGDVVELTARAPRLALLPAALTGPAGLGDIVRTVRVRREEVR